MLHVPIKRMVELMDGCATLQLWWPETHFRHWKCLINTSVCLAYLLRIQAIPFHISQKYVWWQCHTLQVSPAGDLAALLLLAVSSEAPCSGWPVRTDHSWGRDETPGRCTWSSGWHQPAGVQFNRHYCWPRIRPRIWPKLCLEFWDITKLEGP